MSGIVGLLRLDGRPCDGEADESFQRMLAAIAHRGPDASTSLCQGPLALGHAMLRTTPESVTERQPLRDETGELCLVLDGRIDNRVQMQSSLEAGFHHARDGSDADLLMSAYARWGSACAGRLTGDFAFALWDDRRQRLFCARDPMGIKSFYYHCDGRTFRFASEPRALFADRAVRCEPNEGMIGEFLAGSLQSTEETFFTGVMRLRAGHSLTVGDGQVRQRRYWDIDSSRELRYKADEEYASHFLELFTEAVRCRMRASGPVAAELSGGLDSSSVVCVAAKIERETALKEAGLNTFSLVFPGAACDESGYIADVAARCGKESHVIRPLESTAVRGATLAPRQMDVPRFANDMMFDALGAEVRRRGVRTLLTGQGGDDLFSGLYHPYVDHLIGLRLVDLLRQLRLDAGRFGPASVPALCYWHGLRPILRRRLPGGAIRTMRRLLNRDGVPGWIDPHFARRTALCARLRGPDGDRGRSSTWRRLLRERIESGWRAFYNDSADQWAASFGFDYRHPFYDTRIVEFSWALPVQQCWRRADRKIIIPLAMRDLLPESIRQRPTKAEFSEVFVEALRTSGAAERKDFFHSLRIAAAGWVEPGQLRSMFDRMIHLHARGDEGYIAFVNPLWASIAMEDWYARTFAQ
jgi:asparagine synthase (glutamine-hydrolysing)